MKSILFYNPYSDIALKDQVTNTGLHVECIDRRTPRRRYSVMRTLVESLKRLYSAGRLTTEKLDDLLLEGKNHGGRVCIH